VLGGGTGLFRLRYKKQRQDADQERDSDQEKAVGIGHDISLAAHDGLQLSQGLLVTLACRLVTLWLGVCIGWLAVLTLRHKSFSAVEA